MDEKQIDSQIGKGVERANPVASEIRKLLWRPGTRYRVSLAEFVSKVVSSNPEEYQKLKEAVKNDFQLEEQFFDVLRSEDWEKVLNDEANFQFSSRHRPFVEAILNGIDSELRKENRGGREIPDKKVEVTVTNQGMKVKDWGEGMNLDTVCEKLMVPKLTGNLIESTDVIGRFGVGFYSLLSYLRGKNDILIVRTYDGREGYQISFTKYQGENESQRGKLCVVISPLSRTQALKIDQGTEVELKSDSFDRANAESYIKETLKYKTEAKILVNGEWINDFNAFKSSDRELSTRRYGEKQRKVKIHESLRKSSTSKVILAVGGVKVEEFRVNGNNLPETLVFSLPAGTALPKSRDRVEVNEETVAAIGTITDLILSQEDYCQSAKLLSLLTPVITRLQERNPTVRRDMNMDLALQDKVNTWREKLPEGTYLIPVAPGVEKLNLPGALPIEAKFLPSKLEIPGLLPESAFESTEGKQLYWAPFKDPEEIFIVVPGFVFINEKYKTTDPRKLGLLNALMEVYDQSLVGDGLKIDGQFKAERIELKRVVPSPEVAVKPKEQISGDMEEFINSFNPTIMGRPIYEPVSEKRIEDVLLSEAEYQKLVEEETKGIVMPERHGLTAVLDKFFPARVKALRQRIEADRRFIIKRLPKTVEQEVVSTSQEEVGKDYSPLSVEELKHWWIDFSVYKLLKYFTVEPEYQYNSDFKISDSPAFWQEVITSDFYLLVRDLISRDPKIILEKTLASLSESSKKSFLTAIGEEKLVSLKQHGSNSAVDSILMTRKAIFPSEKTEGADLRQFARVALALAVSRRMRVSSRIFNDKEFLEAMIKGKEFSGFISHLLGGQYRYFRRMEGFELFFDHNHIISEAETTQGRFDYLRWLLRNEGNFEALRKKQDYSTFVTPQREIRPTRIDAAGQVSLAGVDWEEVRDGKVVKIHSDYYYRSDHPDDAELSFSFGLLDENVFYLAGIDNQQAWEDLNFNIETIRGLAADRQVRELFFDKRDGVSENYRFPPIVSLAAGRIKKENLVEIVENLKKRRFEKREQRLSYIAKALGYSYLSPAVFSPLNILLYRMATERNPGLEAVINRSYFSDGVREYEREKMMSDGWQLGLNLDEINSSYRLCSDDSELLVKRVNLLSNLPPEYARVYFRLQQMLVNPQAAVSWRQYTEAQKEADLKLIPMFSRIAERPQSEAQAIILVLTDASLFNRDDLEQALKEYGNIDRVVRPWLLYLVSTQESLPSRSAEDFFQGITKLCRFSGSDLVGKYFTTKDLAKVNLLTDLEKVMTVKEDRERAKEVGQRRIEHAASYQSTQGYVWLRELVQNAFNATRGKDVEKVVNIENYLEGANFVITVNDPLGMSLNRVINALLVPQKSEWENEAIGYFGQGFFTVFKEADEVRIKTSGGDGKTIYVSINPIREYKTNKVTDLSVVVGEKEEVFKSTSVSWVKLSQFYEFEAARARAELTTYAGLLPQDQLQILWNKELINKSVEELARVNSELGEVKLYSVVGENTVTQNGLYVREMDNDYTGRIPQAIRKILLSQGISLDIPPAIRLIDSRMDIARKEEVLPLLASSVSEASVRAAVKLFLNGKVKFEQLPYDFYIEAERYAGKVDQQVKEDAGNLIAGKGINWEMYLRDETQALQLILSIPIIEVYDRKLSVYEAIQMVKEDLSLIEKLPAGFRSVLQTEKIEDTIIMLGDRSKFQKEDYRELKDFPATVIPGEFDAYHAWQRLFREMTSPVIKTTERDYIESFYCRPDGSKAHYSPSAKLIGWNILHWGERIEDLGRLIRGEQLSNFELMRLYQELAETGSHEYEHSREGLEEVFTHDPIFFRRQQEILGEMIRSFDPQKIESTLGLSYRGGFLPPAELSRLIPVQVR